MADCQTTCVLSNAMGHLWPSPVNALAAAISVLMGRSLSSRHWPTFTKLVRNSVFECPWIGWYLSLFTYSRGQIYTDLLSLTPTTNKAIDQGTRLFLVYGLRHLSIKYCLKINENLPFPLHHYLCLERQQILPFENYHCSFLQPNKCSSFSDNACCRNEPGVLSLLNGYSCSGEMKGEVMSKWMICKSLVLGFREGQPLMYLQIRTISISVIPSCLVCSSPQFGGFFNPRKEGRLILAYIHFHCFSRINLFIMAHLFQVLT